MKNEIPINLLDKICFSIELRFKKNIPFITRGIKISHGLIKVTVEILNDEIENILPQNSRNAIKEKTPEGLDRKIKESLNTNLRTANIISDVLMDTGVVEVVKIRNEKSGRMIKATRLLPQWCW